MKTFALLLSLGLAATVASAATSKQATSTHPAVKTHQVSAEVVSMDTAKNTITIKGADGAEKTAPVEGKAIASLKTLKAGEKVTLTCRDNDKGEHEAVTAIHPAKVTASKPVTHSATKPQPHN